MSPKPDLTGGKLVYVAQQRKFRQLKDGLTIAVNSGGRAFNVAKISFRPKAPDLYLLLPYLGVNSYRCGVHDVETGTSTEATIDSLAPGVDAFDEPIKFSYHESGQINAKVQGWTPGNRYTRMQGTPISNLSGEQIFVIECEGLDAFKESTPEEILSPQYLAIALPDNIERVKITGYAGFTDEQVTGKYTVDRGAAFLERKMTLPPNEVVEFQRPTLFAPLKLALYVFGGASLQSAAEARNPYVIAMVGLHRSANGVRTLFLQASNLASERERSAEGL